MNSHFQTSSIDNVDLVFFDVETTGLDPEQGAICEIGGVKIRGDQILDTFQTLINPKQPIPKEASRVHGIFDLDVQGTPYFEEAVDKVLSFFGRAVICGYNIGFDLGFLNCELEKINYPSIELPCLDVLLMARRTFTDVGKYNLMAVASYLDLARERRFHRALNDAEVTKDIFLKAKEVQRAQGMTTLHDFITLYGYSNQFFRKTQEPKIGTIKKGITAKAATKIKYLSYSNTLHTYVIIPNELLENRTTTFLIGSNPRTKEALQFDLSRILEAEII